MPLSPQEQDTQIRIAVLERTLSDVPKKIDDLSDKFDIFSRDIAVMIAKHEQKLESHIEDDKEMKGDIKDLQKDVRDMVTYLLSTKKKKEDDKDDFPPSKGIGGFISNIFTSNLAWLKYAAIGVIIIVGFMAHEFSFIEFHWPDEQQHSEDYNTHHNHQRYNNNNEEGYHEGSYNGGPYDILKNPTDPEAIPSAPPR